MLTRQSTYQISNTDETLTPNKERDDNTIKPHDVTIIGTQNFALQYSCLECNSRLTDITSTLTKCPSCRLVQVLESCTYEVAVNLYVQAGDQRIMLKAYTSILKKILFNLLQEKIKLQKVETFLLTRCPSITLSYNKKAWISKTLNFNKLRTFSSIFF